MAGERRVITGIHRGRVCPIEDNPLLAEKISQFGAGVDKVMMELGGVLLAGAGMHQQAGGAGQVGMGKVGGGEGAALFGHGDDLGQPPVPGKVELLDSRAVVGKVVGGVHVGRHVTAHVDAGHVDAVPLGALGTGGEAVGGVAGPHGRVWGQTAGNINNFAHGA